MKVKNIIGFENNPPWFVKKSSIQSALDYLKSSEFKQLSNSKKNLVLLKILKEFNIFGDKLTVNSVIKNLENQELKIKDILEESDSKQKINNYKEFNLLNPLVLRGKIIEKYQNVYDVLNYLNSLDFKTKTDSQKDRELENIRVSFDFKENLSENQIIKRLDNFRKPIEEALNFLLTNFWDKDSFKVVLLCIIK